jgi:uncharacterized membrane protein
MDAVLTPHRSLSLKGYHVLMAAFVAANMAIAAHFIAHGAFPVVGFLGLDVLALWLALRASYRSARLAEHVRVGADQLHLARLSPKRTEQWVVSPLWARVAAGPAGVRVTSGGGALSLGAFLSPDEQTEFAAALRAALEAARRGAHGPSTSDSV